MARQAFTSGLPMTICFSCVWLFVTPRTIARQAPLSMGFSRQEYWSGLLCPPPGDLPNPVIEPASLTSPALAGGFFTTNATWQALSFLIWIYVYWFSSLEYLSCFQFLMITNEATINICIWIFLWTFLLGKYPEKILLGHKLSIWIILWETARLLPQVVIILCIPIWENCTCSTFWPAFETYTYIHIDFGILKDTVVFHKVLICISLLTNNAGHPFLCLLAIHIIGSMGSTSLNSINHGSKIFGGKKFQKVPKGKTWICCTSPTIYKAFIFY